MEEVMKESIKIGQEVFDVEMRELDNLKSRVNMEFAKVVELIYESKGRVIVTGIGKSGIIGKKIAASLASTGTNSFFMHSAEALHGDLGMVYKDDIVIAISNSGSSQEVLDILPSIKRIGATLIAMTGNINSALAKEAQYILDIGIENEACPMNLAPTSSTTATLVMGDALTVALIKRRNFKPEKFALYHPGGALGRKLLTNIRDLMVKELPKVTLEDEFKDIIYEISSKRIGMTLVFESDKAIGIITDGDIRRAISKCDDLNKLNAKQIMTKGYKSILSSEKATIALEKMQEFKVANLVVLDEKNSEKVVGVITMHDLFPFIN